MSAIPWILATVVLVVCGQLLQKAGMQRVGAVTAERLRSPLRLVRDVAREPRVVLGIGVYGASALLWLYVLSMAELSYAFPFLAIAYVGVAAASTLVLKEALSLKQWAGLFCVMAGVVLVAASGA